MLEGQDRYRQQRRLWDLAWRLLSHGARTHTITRWTGLSERRVRAMVKRFGSQDGEGMKRPRGKAPSKMEQLMRSPRKRREAAGFAQICLETGVIREGVRAASEAAGANVGRGESICHAFERFTQTYPVPQLTIDEVMLVVSTLTDSAEYGVATCIRCHAPLLIDRLALTSPHCVSCRTPSNSCANSTSASASL